MTKHDVSEISSILVVMMNWAHRRSSPLHARLCHRMSDGSGGRLTATYAELW